MYSTTARFDKAHDSNGVWSLAAHGDAFASGSVDGTLNLWKLEGSGLRYGKSWRHPLAVNSVSLAGTVVAASFLNGSVVLYHTDTGEALDRLELDLGEATQVALRCCGEVLAIASGKKGVLLYHLPSKNRLALPCVVEDRDGETLSDCCSAAFDTEGLWLTAGCRDGTVHVWTCSDAGTGMGADTEGVGIRTEVHGRWRSDFAPVDHLAVSPDAQYLACAHTSGLVLLWTLPFLELYASLGGGGARGPMRGAIAQVPVPTCLAFAPEAPFIAVGYKDGKVRLFSVGTRDCAATFSEHTKTVMQTLFAPTGDLLLSTGDDGAIVAYSCVFPGPQR